MKIHIIHINRKFYKIIGYLYEPTQEFYDFMKENNINYSILREPKYKNKYTDIYNDDVYIIFKTKQDYIKFKILQ